MAGSKSASRISGQGLTFPVLIVVRHLSGHVQGPPISGKVATVGAIPGAKQGGSPCADRYHLLAIALRPVRSGPRVGAPERVAFRDLKRIGTRDCTCFAAQWLAYALPCRRFARTLTSANARLGAELDRYAFLMVGSHHQLPAGLPAHSHQVETSTRHQHDPIELPADFRPQHRQHLMAVAGLQRLESFETITSKRIMIPDALAAEQAPESGWCAECVP